MRVLIADDHPLFRDGLARAVNARFELVGQAADGREALAGIRRHAPDVAVVDLRMPGLSGLEVIGRSSVPVLVLSAATDSALVYAAVAAGAAGYFSKDAGRDAICDAIAAVGRGEHVLDPSLQAGLFGEIQGRELDGERPLLSDREREILDRIAAGKTAPAIAQELYLSTATVKTHLAHLYEKLGVGDRAAAVAEAMRRGLLE
ncbi:LuxR family two component transcriptional regulator [Solirubrobacter pauli]|uniref:LuxR family two component transcriptional regulator n=1 Tax=Solirubrobacter pauli TaxID=166793 RepID=A0A660LAR7_9ACTN|nr:response regulator transcription factor [Solirubrobacter pauli]RKQ91305.1 LuxR family two component transcriptional regulator [Solirubrobacter pauli]